jgi:CBS domain-containing protein
MGASNLKKGFPRLLNSAYTQYKRDLLGISQVSEIMTRTVITIKPDATMQQAAIVMGKKHIGSLIVKGTGNPLGIITERDLLTKILACGKDPASRIRQGRIGRSCDRVRPNP